MCACSQRVYIALVYMYLYISVCRHVLTHACSQTCVYVHRTYSPTGGAAAPQLPKYCQRVRHQKAVVRDLRMPTDTFQRYTPLSAHMCACSQRVYIALLVYMYLYISVCRHVLTHACSHKYVFMYIGLAHRRSSSGAASAAHDAFVGSWACSFQNTRRDN
jgi:hypothetical protein